MKDSDFTKYCDKATKHSLFLDPVGPDELLNLIKELKDSKSPGPDNIGPSLVKMISQTILFPLIDIFNKSLCTGIVPCKLKVAKVIPIYKKGDPKLTCNYRPISLLSIFDKLLEKVMRTRLLRYLYVNNILYKYQFGFRKNYSTSLALIEVVDSILEHLDNHDSVIGIYLDLQKAFDTVNHNILLYKLFNIGVAYSWFRNYLSGRYQYTQVNDIDSNISKVTCGVPQGSVLGPLLFIIYVNDISNAIPGHKIKLFADDANLFISNPDLQVAIDIANQSSNHLNKWFIANKLSLNIDKTCYMVFPSEKIKAQILR